MSAKQMLAKKMLEEAGTAVEMVNVRRRQERAARTREKILAAATWEFAALGYDGTTTRSIAARAKVQHGLVVYHFETKLAVWQAVMEIALSHFHTAFAERLAALDGASDIERLREMQRTFIRVSAEHPEVHWLLSHEAGEASERLNLLPDDLLTRDIDYFIGLIRRAQREGLYVEGDPAHLLYLFAGAASRVFMMAGEIQRTLGRSPFNKAFLERHIELCEQLFLRDPVRK